MGFAASIRGWPGSRRSGRELERACGDRGICSARQGSATLHRREHARPALVVLSAKNAERLKQQVKRLVAAIERRSLGDADLADVAYTLQVGA